MTVEKLNISYINVQKSKDLISRKRERERSAGGPVGRPEERTDQTITTWATHGLPS